MPNSPILKSGLNLTVARGRRAAKDRLVFNGSVAMFDTKATLYPAQNTSFAGMTEAVLGGAMTYNAPGGGSAVTFSNGLVQFPTDTLGPGGVKVVPYNGAGYVDLATREAGGSKAFLLVMWAKTLSAGSGFAVNMFNIGQGGARDNNPQNQIHVEYTTNNVGLWVAGKSILTGRGLTIGVVYQIAFIIEKDSVAGLTRVTAYLTPNGSAAPVRIGSFTTTYAAFAALTGGGVDVGAAGYEPTSTVQPTGFGFGRAFVEDLTAGGNDPLRQILLDYQLNNGRFS